MREAIARMGRLYLVILMAVFAALPLLVVGIIVYEGFSPQDDDGEAWRILGILLVSAIIYGTATRGAVRRRRWGYYLSWAVTLYSIAVSALPLVHMNWMESPTYVAYLIFVALWLMALVALVLPGARAQFTPVEHNDRAQQAAPLHS